MTTEDFLDIILPGKGLRCVAYPLDQGGMVHKFYGTNSGAAAAIAAANAEGRETYFTPATYADASEGRKARNVLAVRSFWLDIDTDEFKRDGGSPYANRTEATQALLTFANVVGMAPPLMVSSGYGLHVYWPLTADLAPDTWRQTATVLRGLCIKSGLAVDHTRTTDAASLLRPVGTHNHKDASHLRLVELVK